MSADLTRLWEEYAARTGEVVPVAAKAFLSLEGLDGAYERAEDSALREELLNQAIQAVEHLHEAGLLAAWRPSPPEQRIDVHMDDPRLQLLDELGEAIAEERRSPAQHTPAARAVIQGSLPSPLARQRVQIEVDGLLPARTVTALVDRVWRDLRQARLIRRTRPLNEHALALVRLVCLKTSRSDTWATRHLRWNREHPDQEYMDTRAFVSAFRRAAEQLTGSRDGLSWFHDEATRLRYLNRRELQGEAERGNALAATRLALLDRQRDDFIASMRIAGVEPPDSHNDIS